MNCKPRVSIGIPVRNGRPFLQEALNSLLAQTYPDFELIISDNASTDETEAICRTFAAKDARIRYYRNNENLGLGRNFNRVFELSTGEYFKWAAADDLCRPNYLARCLQVLDTDPTVVLAYSKTQFIDENGNFLKRKDPGWDLRSEATHERLRYVIYAGHWVNATSGLIRRNALLRTRLMPTYPGGDYRLLGELSLIGKFFEVPECLFLRRLHPGASSQNTTNLKWMAECYRSAGRRLSLSCWSLSLDHFVTIMRSPLTAGQKTSLILSLLHRMSWERQRLSQELGATFKMNFSGGSP